MVGSFRIRTTYPILTSPREATKQLSMGLRMKLSNENVPADEAGFVLSGFGVLKSPEKMKEEMETC